MNDARYASGKRFDRSGASTQRAAGYTLLEILVGIAIIGILARIALPRWDAKRLQIGTAQRVLIANLRVARSNAVTKSVHYQVSLPTATQLKVAKMLENPAGSGTWQVDTANVQTITLPAVTTLKSTEINSVIEFNSRGLAVNLNATLQLDLQDTFGATKSVQVWPSGQVNDL